MLYNDNFFLKMPTFIAMVYGQGNVRMFDNTWYYVCGEGDFILLQSTMLTIEGRFQKSPFSRKYFYLVPNFVSLYFITFIIPMWHNTIGYLANYNSTILTDVGIRAGNDVIEVKMKGPNADRSKRVLDVLVNGEYQFFDNGPLRRRDFTGFYSFFYINDTLILYENMNLKAVSLWFWDVYRPFNSVYRCGTYK